MRNLFNEDFIKVKIRTKKDVLSAVALTKQILQKHVFTKFDEHQILVAVSELTHNIINHSGVEGLFSCRYENNKLHIFVTDDGIGIQNITSILHGKNAHSETGLGLGLKGIQKLMDEFSIETAKNKGVTIRAVKRKS